MVANLEWAQAARKWRFDFNPPRRCRRGEGKIDKTLEGYESEAISSDAADYGLLSLIFLLLFSKCWAGENRDIGRITTLLECSAQDSFIQGAQDRSAPEARAWIATRYL
jgi:hypothetical protein